MISALVLVLGQAVVDLPRGWASSEAIADDPVAVVRTARGLDPWRQYRVVRELMKAGQFELAIELGLLVTANPDADDWSRVRCGLKLCRAFDSSGRHTTADELLERLLAEDMADLPRYRLLTSLGDRRFWAGDSSAAREVLEQAAALAEGPPLLNRDSAHRELANLHASRGEFEQALQWIDRAPPISGRCAMVCTDMIWNHTLPVRCLLALDRFEEAEARSRWLAFEVKDACSNFVPLDPVLWWIESRTRRGESLADVELAGRELIAGTDRDPANFLRAIDLLRLREARAVEALWTYARGTGPVRHSLAFLSELAEAEAPLRARLASSDDLDVLFAAAVLVRRDDPIPLATLTARVERTTSEPCWTDPEVEVELLLLLSLARENDGAREALDSWVREPGARLASRVRALRGCYAMRDTNATVARLLHRRRAEGQKR